MPFCYRPSLKKAIAPKINMTGSTVHSSMVPEIPENRSAKTHNKFIPMQLRTQPNNLTGQLQRVTTSLLEPRGNQTGVFNHYNLEVIRLGGLILGFKSL